jgi:pimeloyl-ACP methyl ester carboxylesterase
MEQVKQQSKRWVLCCALAVCAAAFPGASGATELKSEASRQEPREEAVRSSPLPAGFTSGYVVVQGGVRLHYVRGGSGEPLVLVHGFPQSWYSWRHLLPLLARHFTVIAPDLRGAGDSDAPTGGYDKETLAGDLRGLVKQLNLGRIHLAGHDIGLMVAYAYAARYPADVRRLALLEAPIPDESFFSFPALTPGGPGPWWFGLFNTPRMPETLLRGREEAFLREFFAATGAPESLFPREELRRYARNLKEPARLAAHLGYFRAFATDVTALADERSTPLPMPVLAIGADRSLGSFVPTQAARYATQVKPYVFENTSHWIPEERPEALSRMLVDFFGAH